MPRPLLAKVVLLGAQGVGKTSILLRLNNQGFAEALNPTIGASFCRYELVADDVTVQLQIWDTAGQERFRAMAPMYYRNASAAFVVYDITSEESFKDAITWHDEIRRNTDGSDVVVCLIANKTDLERLREVPKGKGQEYAERIGAHFCETSALDNTGIHDAFTTVATKLVQKKSAINPDGSVVDTSNVAVIGGSSGAGEKSRLCC